MRGFIKPHCIPEAYVSQSPSSPSPPVSSDDRFQEGKNARYPNTTPQTASMCLPVSPSPSPPVSLQKSGLLLKYKNRIVSEEIGVGGYCLGFPTPDYFVHLTYNLQIMFTTEPAEIVDSCQVNVR